MAYLERLTREEAVSVATALTVAEIHQYPGGLSDAKRARLAEDVLSLVSQLRAGFLVIGKDEPNV